jgi:RimJ/RimL family protein N-acetyltransferase
MGKKVDKTDRLLLLKESDNERYYLFTPRLMRLFPKSGDMRKMNLKEILLHLIRLVHGYKVYILTDDQDNVKGSILFSTGGSFRYPFASKKDLIDGPSFTVPEYRGQGVAVRIGDAVMNEFESDYNVVYGTIREDNVPSLKRVKKNGFVEESKLRIDRLRRFQKDQNGDHVLVAYHNKHKL